MDVPQRDDGLKWFGEGFDGFPKRLPEDCVEYIVHAVDEKLKDAAAIRNRLKSILSEANIVTKNLLKDYLWQRDAFELKLFNDVTRRSTVEGGVSSDGSEEGSEPGSPYLRGRTNFGDSVADEWLIVYVLLELSKKSPDAWIRVYDTDGEFLLIEAANVLPKWLNPEVAENRVWISNGHIRIIPRDEGSTLKNLRTAEALSFIRRTPEKMIISPYIEKEAFHRLEEYPSAISSSLHRTMLSVPRKLAFLLHCNPAYISPAVEAFYLRDPVALRPLWTKDLSNLALPPGDFVTVSVKFSKVGYAQLYSQRFDPPPTWTAVLPRMSDVGVEIGMKLTCGFEMLLADSQNRDKRVVREIKLLLEDTESGEEALPTDIEVGSWPQTFDDEKWLDIDYNDFENELSGKKANEKSKKEDNEGFGEPSAQRNLRKMVERFQDFIKDDTTGLGGANDMDEDDDDDDIGSEDSEEDKEQSYTKEEFEKAMNEMMGFDPDFIEKSGLLDEARKLALDDEEDGESEDEDEEVRKVMEMMDKELKSHGVLDLNARLPKSARPEDIAANKLGKDRVFGPARPGEDDEGEDVEGEDVEGEDVDGELSSEDEDFNDVDLGLAKNMLEAFKGQAGLPGPAGNLMRAMGVNMPRDEGENEENP